MSHIVTIQTEVRDTGALRLACQRLKLEQPKHGTFDLFDSRQTGFGVQFA